jgi:Na+/proline symporter
MDGFKWPDYLVFAIIIFISAIIGFTIGWLDRKKASTQNFLLGGGDLGVVPVGLSIIASFTSAIAILGFSSEIYIYGTYYWMVVLSFPFAQGVAALVYIPIYHGLKLTTAYQYLDVRFNSLVHVTASAVFCLQMFFYMSVALYTPALAIEQVTGIQLEISIGSFFSNLIQLWYIEIPENLRKSGDFIRNF